MRDIKKAWTSKWWGMLIILILALFLIIIVALGLTFLNYSRQIKNNPSVLNSLNSNKEKIDPKLIEGENSYWLGSANPKLTIVEFGDFSCPACKNSFSILREVGFKYKDKVRIIFRNFPVISDYSLNLSLGGECAGEQGLFWPMYDKLYLNQGISTIKEIENVFARIGGNEKKFSTCLKNRKYLKRVQKDLNDGIKLNLKGTPSWFFNGYKINGEIPRDTFLNLVEEILKAN